MSDYSLSDYDSTLSESVESIASQIIDEINEQPDTIESVPVIDIPNENENNSENFSNQIDTSKESKYGDDETFESFADVYLFVPIATRLVDPLRNLGFTPNGITYVSTICTFASIYFLHIGDKQKAIISYIAGYLFDCVDGRMARKYNMGSKYGMALDLVSDNISNLTLFSYLIYTRGFNHWYIYVLAAMTYMMGISYGLNEAITSYKASGSDNFYERKIAELKDETHPIFNLYLIITKMSYSSYRSFFPEYNEEKINKWLSTLKHFGPGNYCLFVAYILYTL